MYSRAKDFIERRISKIKLQLSIRHLPPVATHLASFLLGTILFVPDSSGRVPSAVLMPWNAAKIEGAISLGREYAIVDAQRKCLLFSENYKLFQAEEKKLFVVIPKSRLLAEAIGVLQKSDTRLKQLNPKEAPPPHCEKKNVIIYP